MTFSVLFGTNKDHWLDQESGFESWRFSAQVHAPFGTPSYQSCPLVLRGA